MRANICGNKIRELREEREWGQIDLSAALTVDFSIELSQSDVSEIERGARGIKDYELKAIAAIFDVTTDWLLE